MRSARTIVMWLSLGFFAAIPMIQPAYSQVLETVEIISLQGSYKAFGRNSNGSAYSGKVQIVVADDVAYFRWKVGDATYKGQGKLIGNVLVVKWSGNAPVIYTIDLNGNLAGTWDNGKASERLVRDKAI